jgi:hypothetical protein
MASRSPASPTRLKPKPPPDPSGRHQESAIAQGEAQIAKYQSKGDVSGIGYLVIVRASVLTRCASTFLYDNRDALVAIATAFIAFFTFTLWRATSKLWEAGEKQIGVSKASAAAAEAAARTAIEANQLSRANFVATNRPWIKVDIGVAGPIYYNVNGLNIALQFQLKNIGHSPALHVSARPQVAAPAIGDDNHFDMMAIQHKIIAESKGRLIGAFGYTIFPGDTILQNITVNIGPDELKRITQHVEFVNPVVIGSIVYGSVFEDGPHQTAYMIEVRRSGQPRPESIAKNRSPAAIFPDEGDIPASEVRLTRFPMGNDYAD